jgi:hypothetical protein
MLIGAGKPLVGGEAATLLGQWSSSFIRECGAGVIGEQWRAILEREVAASLSIVEYARASKGEGEDFHSLSWKRPASRESHHILCHFEDEGGRVTPLVGRVKRFVKLSCSAAGSGEEQDLRAAEVELYKPKATYDGRQPTESSTLFRIEMMTPQQEVADGVPVRDRRPPTYDSYMVPLSLIVCKLCRCGPATATEQHFLRYTAYSRTLGGEE